MPAIGTIWLTHNWVSVDKDFLMDLNGKIAVVTGAGKGIGHAIALKLAGDGADVVVLDCDRETGTAAVDQIESVGRQSMLLHYDIGEVQKIGEAVHKVVARFGKIDAWINNAGIITTVPFLDLTEEDWDMVMSVNAKGTFFASQAVAKQMIEQKSGVIVNITSGQHCRPMAIHYGTSKISIDSMTETMAVALGAHNIRVNAVCPGLIDTPMWQDIVERREKKYGLKPGDANKDYMTVIPMARLGTSEEVAATVAFLISDDAAYISGQIINVTGAAGLFSYEITQKGGLSKK